MVHPTTCYERIEAGYAQVHTEYVGRVKGIIDRIKDPSIVMGVS